MPFIQLDEDVDHVPADDARENGREPMSEKDISAFLAGHQGEERLRLPMPKWSVRITNARNALEAAMRMLDLVQDDFTSMDKDCCRSLLFRAGELIGDARILTKDARDDILKRWEDK